MLYTLLLGFPPLLQIPLGVIPKNENEAEGMVDILEQMSEYVPDVQVQQGRGEADSDGQGQEGRGEVVPFPVPLAGDMLTATRARTAREIRVTSCGKKALRGLIPFPADWHAKVNFMEVRVAACTASLVQFRSDWC